MLRKKITVLLTICVLPISVAMADVQGELNEGTSVEVIIENALGEGTGIEAVVTQLVKLSPGEVASIVELAIAAVPDKAPEIVAAAIAAAPEQAGVVVAAAVAVAPGGVGDIVAAAIDAAPSQQTDIVQQAIQAGADVGEVTAAAAAGNVPTLPAAAQQGIGRANAVAPVSVPNGGFGGGGVVSGS